MLETERLKFCFILWKNNRIYCLKSLNEYLFKNYQNLRQKQPSVGIKRCSKKMQQIYRRAPMTKSDFKKQLY